MSAIGTKQTLMPTLNMSAFGGKADMTRTLSVCPLMTQSGHPNSRRNTALRLTLTLFDVRPAAESVCAESTPAYGRFGAGNLEAVRAVSVPGALTSRTVHQRPG